MGTKCNSSGIGLIIIKRDRDERNETKNIQDRHRGDKMTDKGICGIVVYKNNTPVVRVFGDRKRVE